MKIKRLLLTVITFASTALMISVGATFAWLSGATTEVNIENLNGGVISQYFHCGDGSEGPDDPNTEEIEGPFVITRPVHLYHLTELYDKLEGFAEEDYHFQLGYDLENNGNLVFYDYGDDGKLIEGSYSSALNMSEYGSLKPIGTEENPFGGTFDGSNLIIDNLDISGDGVSDIGFFGYVTEGASIKDLYLDHLNIDTTGAVADAHDDHDTNAYVGYLAGHADNARSFTNTYVNNCRISGQSVLTKNDWGYFGKCKNAASIDEFIMRANGENAGWGGSVNMQKMYDRLYDIAGNYTTTNNNYVFEKDIITRESDGSTYERNAKTGYAYTYRDREEGSFVFTRYSSNDGPLSNYMYLNGGTRYHQYTKFNDIRISYNGHNLGVNGLNLADHADSWIWENNLLSIMINGTRYYLTHNLTLSTNTRETWNSNNNLYYTTTSWLIPTYHYLTYNNGWTIGESTFTNRAPTLSWLSEQSNGSDYMDYSGTNVTYFPLITNPDSYEVARKNTGYVIGGSEDNTTEAYPDKTGDIRVSKYSTSDINRSYSEGNLTTVYTINSDLQTTQINSSDYSKYSESKTDFLSMVTDGNIYGLHFMPANINQNHLISAEYALINGQEKTNYEMPASSIDFNVTEKGFINFFAGTYFSGNNSFFSLHHIERGSNSEITSIKEITEIYKSTNERKDYIYKYSDNSYSNNLTSDYSLVFSTNRIKRQTNTTTNAVYYFEIPVNAGEFALGSVDGGTGAYLMYLDIATNGGIDQQSNVDTFGSVEYRSSPDTAENSILLITYEQQGNQNIDLLVVYIESEKRYNITYSGSLTKITITVLNNTDYYVYFNGSLKPGIMSHEITF